MKFPREILLFSPIIVGMLIGQFIVYVLDDDIGNKITLWSYAAGWIPAACFYVISLLTRRK